MSSLATNEIINQVLLQDMARINQHLIEQAVKQWDIDGQGCFACYIRCEVQKSWCRLVVLN